VKGSAQRAGAQGKLREKGSHGVGSGKVGSGGVAVGGGAVQAQVRATAV